MSVRQRVEAVLDGLDGLPAGVRLEVARAVSAVLDASGDAVVRMLEVAERHGGLDDLLTDPEVLGLLELHGLLPDEVSSSDPPSSSEVRVELRRSPRARCELCARPVDDDHPHLLEASTEQLVCACGPCHILFDMDAGDPRYRALPRERRRLLTGHPAPSWWDGLDIPVGLVSLRLRDDGRITATYPGPAGPVESDLDVGGAPLPDLGVRPEVESLVVWSGPSEFEAWAVPYDTSMALVGRLRGEPLGDPHALRRAFLATLEAS